jgi:hypothetical protein
MMNTLQAIAAFKDFCGPKLTGTLSAAETTLRGASSGSVPEILDELRASQSALAGALEVKRIAAQVHVAIHAIGIIRCLPHLLEPGERVAYASLGAGNTGRSFDLETDRRVAEFKFIRWQGGSESIRQNSLFKDFFLLAEDETPKRKYLYVVDTHHPLKFLTGRRALRSVLKDASLAAAFHTKHEDRYERVHEYYAEHKHVVQIQDISAWLPELSGGISADDLSDLPSEEV